MAHPHAGTHPILIEPARRVFAEINSIGKVQVRVKVLMDRPSGKQVWKDGDRGQELKATHDLASLLAHISIQQGTPVYIGMQPPIKAAGPDTLRQTQEEQSAATPMDPPVSPQPLAVSPIPLTPLHPSPPVGEGERGEEEPAIPWGGDLAAVEAY